MLKFGKVFINEDELEAIGPNPIAAVPESSAMAYTKSGRTIPLGVSMDEAEAVLDQADLITVLDSGYMATWELTPAEFEELRMLWAGGYQYIARDGTEQIYAYATRPEKRGRTWEDGSDVTPHRVRGVFSFLTFEQDTPLSISEALGWEALEDD